MLRTEMQSRFQALEKNKKICTHGRNMKRFIKKAVGSFTRLSEKSEGLRLAEGRIRSSAR